ncbi:hypothetical protein A0H81_09061 [Grifola frondosa]|uniref:Uncharacterized protein n=1 Tax=Grifola frondosa TaxID=5627 RepID=A0A1C7M233_GRIFR|nr:hypothetical protein A0H81_09061 [Grifola frondosa]
MADPPHSIHTLARYLISLCVLLLVAGTRVRAYIPAVPTNDTALAEQGGLNITDASKLNLQWFQMGFNSENVSYQLVGAASTGVNKVRCPLPHRGGGLMDRHARERWSTSRRRS